MCTGRVVVVSTNFVTELRKVLEQGVNNHLLHVMTSSSSHSDSPKHTLPSTEDSTSETQDRDNTEVTLAKYKIE